MPDSIRTIWRTWLVSVPPAPSYRVAVPSYDDRQSGAVRSTCLRCGRDYWMTKVEAWCLRCREAVK